jgi:hypothetical protein
MSLLTTLIPAYKPDYLGEVFAALQQQSLQDFRVIVSDDSPGAVITDMIRDGRFGPLASRLHLTVVRGPGNARLNHQRLLDCWDGSTPYVHLLMDDDVVFPSFYQTHLAAHRQGSYAVSVSARWLSQGDSRPAWSLPVPAFIEDSPLRHVPVSAEQLMHTVVAPCENWLGELTNMVWTAQGIAHFPRPPAQALSYYGLMDISAVLEAVVHHPLVYVRDHLSVFRQHAQQTTHGVKSHGHRVTMLVWAACALHAWEQGHLSDAQAVRALAITAQRCGQLYGDDDPVMETFFSLVSRPHGTLPTLYRDFSSFWLALLASHPGTRPQRADLALAA